MTTVLGYLSGWFRLVSHFPDQPDEPSLQMRMQSGSMGFGINMNGILTLSVCQAGLRVGIMRIFGPFSRNFFVPWENVKVSRRTMLFQRLAKLQFGDPQVGTLTIPAYVANKLARAAPEHWPEPGPFPEETHTEALLRVLAEWGIPAVFLVLVLIVSAASMPQARRSPIAVIVLFAVFILGMGAAIGLLRSKR